MNEATEPTEPTESNETLCDVILDRNWIDIYMFGNPGALREQDRKQLLTLEEAEKIAAEWTAKGYQVTWVRIN
jgi:hypothetical protein